MSGKLIKFINIKFFVIVIYFYHFLFSENYLPIEENMEALSNSFPMVQHLTMARMNYNWFDIQRCMCMFPSLQEVSVSFNIVSIIQKPLEDDNFVKICKLTLEGNLISSWDEILKLGSLSWQVIIALTTCSYSSIFFYEIYQYINKICRVNVKEELILKSFILQLRIPKFKFK